MSLYLKWFSCSIYLWECNSDPLPSRASIIGELEQTCSQFGSFIFLRMWVVSIRQVPLGDFSPRNNKRHSSLFMLVFSDGWGPCRITSLWGFKYFVTFLNFFSKITLLFLMKGQSYLFYILSYFFYWSENSIQYAPTDSKQR